MSPDDLSRLKEAMHREVLGALQDSMLLEADRARVLFRLQGASTFPEIVHFMVEDAWDLVDAVTFLIETFCPTFTDDDAKVLINAEWQT